MPDGRPARETNVPRLLPKTFGTCRKVPHGVQEMRHGIDRKEMCSKRTKDRPQTRAGWLPVLAGTNPMVLPSGEVLESLNEKGRAHPPSVAGCSPKQVRTPSHECQQIFKRHSTFNLLFKLPQRGGDLSVDSSRRISFLFSVPKIFGVPPR